jgi:protein TonB
MPRDLFNVGTMPSAATRALSRYTVVCSAAALHLVIIAVVLIAPLLADTVLPKPDLGRVQYVNATFVPPNPPAAPRSATPAATVPDHDAAPVDSPDHISDERPAPALDFARGGLDSIGPVSSNVISIGDTLGTSPPAPPMPTPPVRTAPQKPLPVGGAIAEPVKIHNVAPVYPAIAQYARVEGTVVIQAIISTDGAVQEAHVVSGKPLLNEAALSAVKQWRYTPTTLNKQPVAVIMTVTVEFRLQH